MLCRQARPVVGAAAHAQGELLLQVLAHLDHHGCFGLGAVQVHVGEHRTVVPAVGDVLLRGLQLFQIVVAARGQAGQPRHALDTDGIVALCAFNANFADLHGGPDSSST